MKLKLTRRNFLRSSSFGLLGAGVFGKDIGFKLGEQDEEELPKIKTYRPLGRTGFKVSDIGTGIPVNETILKALIKSGVNYIDTAEEYFNGNNERLIGRSIKEFDRKSLFITTKLVPEQGFVSREDIISRARKCLERLQTEYIDCLMIHSANTSEIIKNENFHNAVRQLKSEGRVRFCGVSCHGEAWKGVPDGTMENVLMTAVEDGRFDVLLLAYNFIQKSAGDRILKACKEKSIGTAIMKANPILDYSQSKALVTELEQEGKEIHPYARYLLKSYKDIADKTDSLIKKQNFRSNDELFKDIAITFVLSNPNVNTVLMRFTNFDNLIYHLKLSGKTLTASDKRILIKYEETFGRLYCRHACGICEGKCPNDIPVNTIMRFNHYFLAQKREKFAMQKYAELPGLKAESCSNCEGFCESACPYKVPIKGLLNIAHNNLTLV